ncbi:MAG: autotransporter outer membrane beta-barrel domain-containing protein [Caulobacteraceae bacterium]
MRIKRKIQLAGLAMVMAGVGAGAAHAGDVTVTTATTTPLATSNPDGSATPGDITVAATGSITVDANEAAITVDSSNDVTVQGTLSSLDADNSIGIAIEGGNSGAIAYNGSITLTEGYTLTDTDNDGDRDGELAIGTNRHGIFLQAGPTFTGDISGTGSFTVEGNNSSAVTLDALLTGALNLSGAITVVGEDSVGVAVNGGVTEDVILSGPLNVTGQNSVGLSVTGDVGGEVSVSGSWNVTGYLQTTVPANQGNLEPGDTEQAGSAVFIAANVADGVTIEGIGVENDDDDDGDGLLPADDANDDAGALITQLGSAPAVHVFADGSNITLGAGAEGYSLYVRGNISVSGLFDGRSGTAIRIEGDGLGSAATLTGGVAIDGNVAAGAAEADAYALFIGDDAIVPNVLVRGNITTNAGADAAMTSYGLFFDTGANVGTLENTGGITTNYFGETGDARAITDASGTLTTLTNSGSILARIIATDDDPTDGVDPPPITGSAIAIDLSASSGGVLVEQVAPTVFTDDDADDEVVANEPLIIGDILLGSGGDTLDLLDGSIVGDVSFGAGADAFNIDNGGAYSGIVDDSDGALTLNVTNGELNLMGGTLNITGGTFGADGVLRALLSDVPAETTVINAGSVTFLSGASVIPIVPDGLPAFGSQIFLTAGAMFGAGNVVGPTTGSTAFLYNISVDAVNPIVEGGANSLEAVFDLKSPAELGLSANQTIAFDPIIAALRLDPAASAAIGTITSEYEFFDAYEDLMPNYSSASTEIAATAIQQMQSATSNRMAATRMQGLDEVSVWGQEIAYGLNREAPSFNSQEFRGQGFGFAAGVDGPTDNGAMFGLSASFIASEVEEPGRPAGEISAWFGQANAYYATAMGPIDLDFIVGAGAGKMQSRRFVEIGNPVAFSALSEADWLAYEGHGAIRASAPMTAGWFTLTPQAALTYVGINEEGYTEEGGGPAVDYQVDSTFSQRLWGDVGVELSARWQLGASTILAPRLYGGYRANLIDEAAERTVQFASGGPAFTLTDEGVGDGGPLVGIGFDATNGYSTFSLGYEGEFGDQIERHSLNAAIRFRF